MKGKNRLKKITYSAIFICLLGVLSFLWTEKKQEQILTQSREENILSIFVEGEKVSAIPKKDSGYTLDTEKSTCTNGVTLSFDYNTWSVKANYTNYQNTSNSRVKCNLYFKKRTFAEAVVDCGNLGKDAGTCIKENNHLTTEVVSDETVDNNLRFVGADPNNYVWFNEELWRIIGVMNNIDDGAGKKETRLKIIRDESIGEYSWDSSASNINSGYGANEWSQADLMKLLNPGYEEESIGGSLYWNRTSGSCYNGQNNTNQSCEFENTGLNSLSKTMIDKVTWNTGSNGNNDLQNVTTLSFYNLERGQSTGNICTGNGPTCNDGITRTTTWEGYIGLLYPSDYGFASYELNDASVRETCLNTPLYSWSTYEKCYSNNWLFQNTFKWTLMPSAAISNAYFACLITDTGLVSGHFLANAHSIYPVLYLKSSIKITAGEGSKENPYQLSGN